MITVGDVSQLKNVYEKNPQLLKSTQKKSNRIWNIVKCVFCGTKFDMWLVRWIDSSPECPHCKAVL